MQHPFQTVRGCTPATSAPISRFSRTDMSGKTLASCGVMFSPSFVTAWGRKPTRLCRACSVAKDDVAAARSHQPVDGLQQGRFAAAVGPDHGDDGAGVDRNAVQHVFAGVAADEVTPKGWDRAVHAFAAAAPTSGVPACVPR